jgi:hypothetical protein
MTIDRRSLGYRRNTHRKDYLCIEDIIAKLVSTLR